MHYKNIFFCILFLFLIIPTACQTQKSDTGKIELSELQLTACNSAEKGNTCETKLEGLGLVTQEECCNAIGKCC